MKKYSEQLKLAAVETYRTGGLGWKRSAALHDVEPSSLRKWVAAFEVHGVEGLREKRRELYGIEFRLQVLQRVRDEGLSYRQAAALFNIRSFNIIGRWERAYERDGMSGLEPKRTGPKKQMSKPKPPSVPPPQLEDKDRSREQLIAELNSLRLENTYLKKLDALVQSQTKSALVKGRKS